MIKETNGDNMNTKRMITLKKAIKRIYIMALIMITTSSLIFLPSNASSSSVSNQHVTISYKNKDKGTVMVKYKKSTKKKLKVQITGPDQITYTYDIKAKKSAVFPLSAGNGKYTVNVYKGIKEDYYGIVGTCNIQVSMKNELNPFLRANQYVNYTSKSKCVKKAKTLCKKKKSEIKKVEAIYKWTLKTLEYDYDKAVNVKSGYLPNLDKIYESKKGICFDYASMMCAMLRSQKIPARLVVGYTYNTYHAWINVYTKKKGWITGAIYFDGKQWHNMDPTFADSADNSKEIIEYIENSDNYTAKYYY